METETFKLTFSPCMESSCRLPSGRMIFRRNLKKIAKDNKVNDRQVTKGRQATREKPARVSEGLKRKKTEKRDFRCFVRAKNGARAKKGKRGEGKGKIHCSSLSFFCLPPHFFARTKHRKSHSSFFLFSPTPRKRLLRRLTREVNELGGFFWLSPFVDCRLWSQTSR